MSARHLPALTSLAAALLAAQPVFAAQQAVTLDPQVITANPLGSDALAAPTSVVEGDDRTLRKSAPLGEVGRASGRARGSIAGVAVSSLTQSTSRTTH